jgi:hypothetical protein
VEHTDQTANGQDLSTVLEGIVSDARRLIEQQFDLLRHDFTEELDRVKKGTLTLGVGAGLTATAGVLGTHMLVELLHSATRLPLWACYGVVGGLLGTAGVKCLSAGMAEVVDLSLISKSSVQAFKENVSALAQGVGAATG